LTKSDLRSTDPVTAYALAVVNERTIACHFVKEACKRHLYDLDHREETGMVWKPQAANTYIRFFHLYLHHSKGEAAGTLFKLEPWQAFCVGSVFGWYRKTGIRRYQTAYLELGKKNGKSTLAAGFAIIGLVADNEQGAEVYSTATKKDQARIVFNEAQRMVAASPELNELIVTHRFAMAVYRTNSKFEPLSSDEKFADGLNPSFVVVDELHRHKNRNLRNLMQSGQISRRQPIMIIITTAGDDNPASAYAVEHDYAEKVLEKVIDDDSYFAYITTVDDKSKWEDPREWAKANPNLGISVSLDFLAKLCQKAKESPIDKADFLRYHLNVRTSDVSKYIDMELWRKNGKRFDPETLKGRKCYGGLDLSSRVDISAWVLFFEPTPEDPKWKIVCRFWKPGDLISAHESRDRAPFRLWVEEGWIEATPGNVIDFGVIRRQVIQDAQLYDIRDVAFDPWNASQLAVELDSEGIQVYEFVQGLRSYSEPTKELESKLLQNQINHGNNPVLTWMASNLAVQTDKNLNRMPHKQKSTGRIDGMSALIMAIGRSMSEDVGEPSIRTIGARGGDEAAR